MRARTALRVRRVAGAIATAGWLAAVPVAHAQTTAPAPAPQFETKTTSLPAKGLFEGEALSATARQRLTELIVEAIGLQIQVALVVPTGPWRLDGSGPDEKRLTPGRLEAVKRFLTERGVDPKRIYVESRIDDTLKEPRLDVQIGGRQAAD